MRCASFYPMIAFVAATTLGLVAKSAEPEEMCGKMAGAERSACMEKMEKAKGMAAKEAGHMKGRSSEMKGMGAQRRGKGAEMRERAADTVNKARPK